MSKYSTALVTVMAFSSVTKKALNGAARLAPIIGAPKHFHGWPRNAASLTRDSPSNVKSYCFIIRLPSLLK